MKCMVMLPKAEDAEMNQKTPATEKHAIMKITKNISMPLKR